MKVTDAVWETRNLGVRTFEIMIEQGDTIDNFVHIHSELLKKEAQYIVIKMPSNKNDFLYMLPKYGYTFVETIFYTSLKVKNYQVPKALEQMDRNFTLTEVIDNTHLERVLSEVEKGIFDTDRISMDPNFSKEQSARRYVNWIRDMTKARDCIFEVNLSNQPFGFFTLKQIDQDRVYPVLLGCYEEYKDKGLGALLVKKCNDYIWSLGYKEITTCLSSNNINIFKCNLLFGTQISSIYYTFVKYVG